ncbi:MAG TPA: tRNA(Ile)(2)-agmatinylcytidine synthase [Methanomassiliicoccaceae archaeon]|mgnify:CR=1 FL=1|jgi:tRNA(Ile2)-agmatinylcytidine synthase|nr:DUF1743 domain-containing protein [Euryarchaeota archaeon]HOB38487.1 tRNA(Ile)(2)-agmatinylcytidine synthase [Methanomassiliicoccaceae archaeon]HOK28090.1 tRNA(Ile)(2)-agmatinylcytidine synthase [Methanomassiliicoccaceae archaeon]HPP44229.1 tRNA(Ile)(2)-agmatinylcytidine synthase [Methanomassiliicoccaceae archaeon]HQA21697.1 tRNA(Ile)(2)-agmatinylcytidine synthase [Methanomassiliicoccaceae archaeon]
MFIAVDDTDSPDWMCTTFLAVELIKAFPEWDLIGMPRLVRLNPAVPWKTRGNASVAINFGKGKGDGRLIGEAGGHLVRAYPRSSDEPDQEEALERASRVVEKWAQREHSDPGLVVLPRQPDESLYRRAVTTIVGKEDALDAIRKAGGSYFQINDGRGLIGATSAVAWRPVDRTYELLTYRQMERWGTEREVSEEGIRRLDKDYPSTFNNYDVEAGRPAIIPHTKCPILYGIRGDSAPELVMAMLSLISEKAESWQLFITNQGTDDHIIAHWKTLVPNSSYSVTGEVIKEPWTVQGGHVLIGLRADNGIELEAAAYEPSKSFRDIVKALRRGDRIRVLGEVREDRGTLNIEKMEVLRLAPSRIKVSNPLCVCGKRMKSVGAGQGYRCRECGTRAAEAITEPEERTLQLGWYEPPVCARRHLSKPLKRMGIHNRQ